MMHWKLTLSYHGSAFHGWQVQPELATVQGTLAAALKRITGETVLPQGAGRTDAGVHALEQVASFCLQAAVPPANLHRALNRLLPPSMRVLTAELVSPAFHARHSARGKVYEYRIFERRHPGQLEPMSPDRICSPFLAPFVWDCRWPLHLQAMQHATALLPGTHDFSAMAAASRLPCAGAETEPDRPPSGEPNPVKTIYSADWTRTEDLLRFRICGSGFLHHMVRNLVGTLVEVGRGSLSEEDFPRILTSRDRAQAGPTAPASGLFLVRVLYGTDSSQRTDEADALAWMGAGA